MVCLDVLLREIFSFISSGPFYYLWSLISYRYGPIPRYVFEQTRDKDSCQWDINITTALNWTDLYNSLTYVSGGRTSASTAPDAVAHTVIHMRSSPPYLQPWYCLASSMGWKGGDCLCKGA